MQEAWVLWRFALHNLAAHAHDPDGAVATSMMHADAAPARQASCHDQASDPAQRIIIMAPRVSTD